MLLGKHLSLSEEIVFLLARTPILSAEEILAALAKSGKDFSRRGVFKELLALQQNGAVIKVARKYSLRLPWLYDLLTFAEDAFRRYEEAATFQTLFSDTELSRLWRFNDLQRLDDFWIQIAYALFEQTEEKELLYWVRHPWFQFLHPEKERQWQNALLKKGFTISMLISKDTPLARVQAKDWDPNVLKYRYGRSELDLQRAGTVTVIGDYIVRVSIDRRFESYFEQLYRKVKTEHEIPWQELNRVITEKGSGSLKIERLPRRAAKLRRVLSRS